MSASTNSHTYTHTNAQRTIAFYFVSTSRTPSQVRSQLNTYTHLHTTHYTVVLAGRADCKTIISPQLFVAVKA